MKTRVQAYAHRWPLRDPFVISRGTQTDAEVIIVTLERDGRVGRGEAMGVGYHGETIPDLLAQIEAVRAPLETGIDRQALRKLLPNGGARSAVDAAMWDLEAKLSGISVWDRAGVTPGSVTTNVTIGIRSLEDTATRAR
jgi:L-alanine-DL-glutamate epimerase-like enolase superfamily enzyme